MIRINTNSTGTYDVYHDEVWIACFPKYKTAWKFAMDRFNRFLANEIISTELEDGILKK